MDIKQFPAEKLLSTGLVLVIFITSLSKIIDTDIWYHLSIGKEIVSTFSIPSSEFLVYPNEGAPIVFHEWGYGVLVYLIHFATGLTGLSVFNALIISLIFLSFSQAPMANKKAISAQLLTIAIVFFNIDQSRYFRPELILYAALAVEICLLERFLETKRLKWLIVLPLVALLLTQAHPSVIFLLYVLGCYTLVEILRTRNKRPFNNRSIRQLIWTGVFMLVFSAINPYGVHQIIEPIYFSANKEVLSKIAEFGPSLQSPANRWNFIFLACCGVFTLLADRRRLVINILLIPPFILLAYLYQRNISLLAVVLFIPLLHAMNTVLTQTLQENGNTSWQGLRRNFNRCFGILSAIGLLVLITLRVNGPTWGTGVVPEFSPVRPAAIINEVQPEGRMFNFLAFGGYLAWEVNKNNKVFIDGRNNRPSKAWTLYRATIVDRSLWQKVFKTYGISTVVAPIMPFTIELLKSPEWDVSYVSFGQLLLFKNSAVPELPEEFRIDKPAAWKQASEEAAESIRRQPRNPFPYLVLAEAAAALDDRHTAVDALQKYLDLVPRDEYARVMLNEMLGSM